MRIERPRITVRRLMLAVLLVAALLGAFEAGRRWEAHRRAAQARELAAKLAEAVARDIAALRAAPPAPATSIGVEY